MVRAKFTCQSVKKYRHWNQQSKGFLYSAEFIPVTDNSEENKRFFEATPAGKIELSTYREDFFEPGKSYYVDFSPAD